MKLYALRILIFACLLGASPQSTASELGVAGMLARLIDAPPAAVERLAGLPIKPCLASATGAKFCNHKVDGKRVQLAYDASGVHRVIWFSEEPSFRYSPEDLGLGGTCSGFFAMPNNGDRIWTGCPGGLMVNITPLGENGTATILIGRTPR